MIDSTLKVYQMFGDDCSKEIYGQRVLYSLTNDDKYIHKLVNDLEPIRWLRDKLKGISSPNVLLYGAGFRGKRLSWICPDLFRGFVDEDLEKHGKLISGLKVYSLHEAIQCFADPVFVISNKFGVEKIESELMSCGTAQKNILNLGEKMTAFTGEQYFDLEELKPSENEVFVDCGAFDGDSAFAFMKWCNNHYKHIYCFEPDKKNYVLCRQNLSEAISKEKCTVFNKGTWSSNTELSFSDTADVASHICDDGLQRISVEALDQELLVKRNEKVTFIKMDIEGAELETLKGASRLIAEQKPKLAVCVYHKPEDIFTIPEYLRTLNPDYKFYLRHYTFAEWDTVLYAIP